MWEKHSTGGNISEYPQWYYTSVSDVYLFSLSAKLMLCDVNQFKKYPNPKEGLQIRVPSLALHDAISLDKIPDYPRGHLGLKDESSDLTKVVYVSYGIQKSYIIVRDLISRKIIAQKEFETPNISEYCRTVLAVKFLDDNTIAYIDNHGNDQNFITWKFKENTSKAPVKISTAETLFTYEFPVIIDANYLLAVGQKEGVWKQYMLYSIQDNKSVEWLDYHLDHPIMAAPGGVVFQNLSEDARQYLLKESKFFSVQKEYCVWWYDEKTFSRVGDYYLFCSINTQQQFESQIRDISIPTCNIPIPRGAVSRVGFNPVARLFFVPPKWKDHDFSQFVYTYQLPQS